MKNCGNFDILIIRKFFHVPMFTMFASMMMTRWKFTFCLNSTVNVTRIRSDDSRLVDSGRSFCLPTLHLFPLTFGVYQLISGTNENGNLHGSWKRDHWFTEFWDLPIMTGVTTMFVFATRRSSTTMTVPAMATVPVAWKLKRYRIRARRYFSLSFIPSHTYLST